MRSITFSAQSVITAIIVALEENLNVVIKAAKDAHFAATHSESVAETKYDTFGLESSYLAQGQQKRVEEVSEALAYFTTVAANFSSNPNDCQKVELLNLVSLANEVTQRHFFVAPHSGGLTIEVDGQSVIVVTPQTPMGKKLLGQMVDDEVEILVKGQSQLFELVDIG